MPASVGYLVIDTTDPGLLVTFWCGLLDVEVDTTIGEGQFILLTPTADGLTVGFRRVPDAKAGKNRLHFDLIVGDLDVAHGRGAGAGWRWLESDHTRELEGFRWRQMADPEGNEFDLDARPPG